MCLYLQVTFQVIIALRAAQLLSYASASLTAPVSSAPRAVLCRNMMSSVVSRDSVNGDSAAVLIAFYKLSNQLWLPNLPLDNISMWFLLTAVVIRKLHQQSSDIFVMSHTECQHLGNLHLNSTLGLGMAQWVKHSPHKWEDCGSNP